MFTTDYRALQRTDLRDTGASAYFADPELDGFHQRALREYARYQPLTKQLTLSIPAGQALTALPADFISPDPRTFLAAVGAVPCAPGGYSDVYSQSEAFQPVLGEISGSAYNPTYLNDFTPSYFPMPKPTTATLIEGNPPSLLLDPAPARAIASAVLYRADYLMPTVSVAGSLPDRQSGIVLDLACHLACEALLGDASFLQSYKITDEAINRGAVVVAITAKSQRKRAAFDRETRLKAIGSMG
jgi:hypothetical protein